MTASRVTSAIGPAVPDVLGDGYEALTIELPDDGTDRVRATLVRHRATAPTERAVLYVHGYVDYFFQTALAEFHSARGSDFYALDLHGYGRSLLPGQEPYVMHDVSDYFRSWKPPWRTSRARGTPRSPSWPTRPAGSSCRSGWPTGTPWVRSTRSC